MRLFVCASICKCKQIINIPPKIKDAVYILGKKSPAHLGYLGYKMKTIMLMDMYYISH